MYRQIETRLGGIGLGVAIAMAAATGAAQAATITAGSLAAGGVALDLEGAEPCGASGGFTSNVGVFFRGSGPRGSGTASCGNHGSPQVKDPDTPHPFGRYALDGGAWIDSNDVEHMVWKVDIGKPVKGVSFQLSDAHDQKNSHFSIEAGDATWSIDEREENGTEHLIRILFNDPEADPTIVFHTRLNDGYGLSQISVQPVPVPPAALLLISGVAAAAALRRRAAKRAA